MANEDCRQGQPTNIVSWVAVGTHADPGKLPEPTDGSFDKPPEFSQSTAVCAPAFRNDWFDVSLPEFRPIPFVVVATVALQSVGATTRSADMPGDRWDVVDQGNGFFHIVAVARSQMDCDRDTCSVGENVDLAAGFATIDGTGASFRPSAASAQVTAVDQEALEIDFIEEAQMVQQELLDAWPDPGDSPHMEPTPAGHAAAAAHFGGEILPGDARLENEDNAGEGTAIIKEWPPAFRMRRM